MKAIIRIIVAAAALTGLAGASSAQMSEPRNLRLGKESRLWIEGTSTVKAFTCTATKVDVSVSAEPGVAPGDMVESASLVVPVASLDCRNSTMNGHMQKALKASANPNITWRMSSYRVEGSSVVINGYLTIAGKENPIELRAAGAAETNGTIRVKGSTKFNMTQYGVKPPTLMLGAMKVGDAVTVSYDLVLSP